MRAEAMELWQRAQKALETTKRLMDNDPDAAASRAYYSAFYAVSAYFAFQNKFFSKHSGIESAVHRDLVKEDVWSKQLGTMYSSLVNLRTTGDYGGGNHVCNQDAWEALQAAEKIITAVSSLKPEVFIPE